MADEENVLKSKNSIDQEVDVYTCIMLLGLIVMSLGVLDSVKLEESQQLYLSTIGAFMAIGIIVYKIFYMDTDKIQNDNIQHIIITTSIITIGIILLLILCAINHTVYINSLLTMILFILICYKILLGYNFNEFKFQKLEIFSAGQTTIVYTISVISIIYPESFMMYLNLIIILFLVLLGAFLTDRRKLVSMWKKI